jgi:hypothetical protein
MKIKFRRLKIMAVTKQLDTTTLCIEVQKGVDNKKSFNDVRATATPDDVYAVADAIKGVLSASTRNYLLNESSVLNNQ